MNRSIESLPVFCLTAVKPLPFQGQTAPTFLKLDLPPLQTNKEKLLQIQFILVLTNYELQNN